mgnify:CR=1 FL=1
MADVRYTAYLSYSHQDAAWAEWLHRALEGYRVPSRLEVDGEPVRKRSLAPVFRDRDDLSSSPDLGEHLHSALEQSAHLVVLCSPASAESRWVNEEIRTFRALGRGDRIHCVVVDGDPGAPLGEGGCFPPALFEGENARQREPLAADPRKFADGKRLALLKVAAGLLGVRLDALRRRDLGRRRRVQALAAVGVVVAVVLVGFAVHARFAERAERAQAEQMAAFIVDLGDELKTDIDLESLGRMSETAMRYLDQINPSRLSPASRVKVGLALRQVGTVNWHQGKVSEAREALERSLQVFTRLSENLPADDEALVDDIWFELSQAEFYMGYLLVEMGQTAQGLGHLDRYLEIAQVRHDALPGDPRWLLELSYATSALINAGLSLDEPVTEQVLASIDDNIELARRAMEANDSSIDALAHYGNELAFAGDAFMAACAPRQSLEVRRESLSVSEDLLVRTAASSEFETEVAFRQRGLANVLVTLGDPDGALSYHQSALQALEKLFNRDPSNESLAGDVASSHRVIGRLLMYVGDLESAARHHHRAFELMAPMVSDEEMLTWQLDEYRNLVGQQVTRARLAGQRAEALELLDRNRALLASTEAGGAMTMSQLLARAQFRYERWRLTGSDPAEESAEILDVDFREGEHLLSCHEADWSARLAVLTGDWAGARYRTEYLADAGYRDPGYMDFCRAEGLCEP